MSDQGQEATVERAACEERALEEEHGRWNWREEAGAQLVEYAMILALVAVLSIPLLGRIGSTVFSFFASYMSGLGSPP